MAKFKATVLGMIFFNHMIGRSLIDSLCMHSCKEKNAELEKICSQVEIGLFARAWLIGQIRHPGRA